MILEIPGTTTFKQIIPKYIKKSMSVTIIAKNENEISSPKDICMFSPPLSIFLPDTLKH